MKNYITVEKIEEEMPFVKLAITTKEVDSKNMDDLKNSFTDKEFSLSNLTSNIQIHSDIVNAVDFNDVKSKKEGDALITNLKNVPLLVFTADCVPVAIIDKQNKAIGVAHAGWKGTYLEIAKKTIEKMQELYKTDSDDIVCVIGPSIGECCYEVSEELFNKFKDKFKNQEDKLYKIKDNKFYLNLWEINKYSLESIGVKESNIICYKIYLIILALVAFQFS